MAVHERHLILVLEVAHRAKPSDGDRRPNAAREIDEEALELTNFDARIVADGGPNEVFALLDSEQRLLGDVDGESDDESIDEPETSSDEILMTAGDRIKGPGIKGDAGHGAGVWRPQEVDATAWPYARVYSTR